MDTYTDACPIGDPGDHPAAPPVGIPEQVNGGILTAHQCSSCGAAWETWWWQGWPVERLLAEVTPDRADRNRAPLESSTRKDEAA